MIRDERRPTCPECGQLLVGHRFGVRFGPLARRLIDAVQRAAPDGISALDLLDIVYSDRAGGSLDRVKGYVCRINEKLSEHNVPMAIRGGRGGAYRITTLKRSGRGNV